jgi:hypothetical protein
LILRGDLGAGDDTLEIQDFPQDVADTPGAGAGRTILMGVDLGLGRNRVTLPAFGLDGSFASFDVEGGDAPTAGDTVRLVIPEGGLVLKQRGRFFCSAAGTMLSSSISCRSTIPRDLDRPFRPTRPARPTSVSTAARATTPSRRRSSGRYTTGSSSSV